MNTRRSFGRAGAGSSLASGSGKDHRIRVAIPGRAVARRLGLNRNHHARVWCECMRAPVGDPDTYSVGAGHEDPRGHWSWDALGIVDLREPGSALRLFRAHVESCEKPESENGHDGQ